MLWSVSGQHPLDDRVCGPQAPAPYGSPGDEVRLFLTEDGYRQPWTPSAPADQIKRYAHVVEGHILDFKPRKKPYP